MNVEIYDKTIALCKKFIDQVEKQNSEVELHLDENKGFLEYIRRSKKDDKNTVLISNIKDFKKFIRNNGVKKMFLDINLGFQNAIDLAEELNLRDCFGELVFISEQNPSTNDMRRIDKLGGKFVNKSEHIDKINEAKGK